MKNSPDDPAEESSEQQAWSYDDYTRYYTEFYNAYGYYPSDYYSNYYGQYSNYYGSYSGYGSGTSSWYNGSSKNSKSDQYGDSAYQAGIMAGYYDAMA